MVAVTTREDVRVPYAVRQIVQHELYHYPVTLKRLDDLRRDIAQSGGETVEQDSPPRRHQIAWSDPTHFRGTALATDEHVQHLARVVRAIEAVRDDLPSTRAYPLRECMRLTWWSGLSNHEIEDRLKISERTRQRWTAMIIAAVAVRMGLWR